MAHRIGNTQPLILAIELSQREGSVALGYGRAALAMRSFASGGVNDEDALMPAIDEIVRSEGRSAREISAVVVSIGPGGFTGLRIAVTTAKLLSECLSIPIVAVPSALVAAAAASGAGPRMVALASKRDSVWLSMVEGERGDVRLRGAPCNVASSGSVPNFDDVRMFLADAYVPEPFVAAARRAGILIEPPSLRADACLEVGICMLNRGETADCAALVPLYPREPEAVTLWRERNI